MVKGPKPFMSDTPLDTSVTDDLDLFSSDFFGQKPATDDPPEEAISDETSSDETESDALDHTHEDDTLADEDDSTEEAEGDEPPAEPKQKKNRLQERIDELTAGRREAERAEAAARAEIAELKARLDKLAPVEAPAPAAKTNNGEPTPDDKNPDGTDKYPLGDFDPQYIRDLTKFAQAEAWEQLRQSEAAKEEQKEIARAQAALQQEWNTKLEPAQERYPDFRERSEEMITHFESKIDPAYGEYLTARIMEMDYGPDVLYYLANNMDEAISIVNSGPAKATLALGRIEAKFIGAAEEKQTARPKVSKAPPPPAHINKGSAIARTEVPADTEDLEAFSSQFFKKRRR